MHTGSQYNMHFLWRVSKHLSNQWCGSLLRGTIDASLRTFLTVLKPVLLGCRSSRSQRSGHAHCRHFLDRVDEWSVLFPCRLPSLTAVSLAIPHTWTQDGCYDFMFISDFLPCDSWYVGKVTWSDPPTPLWSRKLQEKETLFTLELKDVSF